MNYTADIYYSNIIKTKEKIVVYNYGDSKTLVPHYWKFNSLQNKFVHSILNKHINTGMP